VSEVQISLVPTEHVTDVWPAVIGYAAAALEHAHGRYELEDTLQELLMGTHLLWVAFEDQHIKGAFISRVLQYPRKRFLECTIMAGEEFSTWKAPMLEVLRRFARDNDCEGIEATARIGWARVFKDDGYEALWQTFQLPVGVNHG
jgi:hypothetical protein